MEPLIIRKAALNLYLLLALSILSFLFFVYIFYDDFTIIAVVGLFPAWLFIYALRELIQKRPYLTFTENELIVKDRDFYTWENIKGFGFSVEEVGRDNAGSIYKNTLPYH
jgi:hypothetical protein